MALLDFVSIDFYFKLFFAFLALAPDQNTPAHRFFGVQNRHFVAAVGAFDFSYHRYYSTSERSPPLSSAAVMASVFSCSDFGRGRANRLFILR